MIDEKQNVLIAVIIACSIHRQVSFPRGMSEEYTCIKEPGMSEEFKKWTVLMSGKARKQHGQLSQEISSSFEVLALD